LPPIWPVGQLFKTRWLVTEPSISTEFDPAKALLQDINSERSRTTAKLHKTEQNLSGTLYRTTCVIATEKECFETKTDKIINDTNMDIS
jgi:hypothetical protein